VLDRKDMAEIRTQVLHQLYAIHSHGFIHSDIKIANILFDEKKKEYVICDFGLSEFYGFPAIKKEYVCTDYFKAPEKAHIKNNINYDVYSLGATLYYLNELKFKPNIDKKTIFSPIITELLNADHTVSAKTLLKKQVANVNNWVDELIRALNLSTASVEKTTDINDAIFLDLSVKNNRYHSYVFGQPELYELEYLDDMFLAYANHQLAFHQNNNLEIKLKILQVHKNIHSHLETMLFAWFLIDNVPPTTLLDPTIEGMLYFNYSCKLFEFNTVYKLSIHKYVAEVEFNITSHIVSKKIAFTPAVFYLYYFLYAISKTYPSHYYLEYRILEGVALPLMLLYFLAPKPVICSELTYVQLSHEILLGAIEFVLHKKINNRELLNCILATFKMIPYNLIQYLVENNDLLRYLSACATII
jgi:serine/threonine protein kinase